MNEQILESLIFEYQQMLMGNTRKRSVSNKIWDQYNDEYNNSLACAFIRYWAKHFMQWSPAELQSKLNESIIEQFCLKNILVHIIRPIETDKDDFYIYAHCCYPDLIPYDFAEQTLIYYKRKINMPSKRMARGFFRDERGAARAKICLRYILSQNEAFYSIQQMYRVFATKEGLNILDRNHLTLPVDSGYVDGVKQGLFATPLDYLHASLPREQRDNILYYKLKYWDSLDSALVSLHNDGF